MATKYSSKNKLSSRIRKSSNNLAKSKTNGHNGSQGQRRKDNKLNSLFQKGEEKRTLNDVFVNLIKDVYSAEEQLIEALPGMAEAANNEQLQDAFWNHLDETERHLRRLKKIFERFNIDTSDVEECEAMKGLIEEGKEIISTFKEGSVRDSALIIGAQKIEHYEIATYGSLRTLAEVMKLYQVSDLLDRTLEEEEFTDILLTEISEQVNDDALYYYEMQNRNQEPEMKEEEEEELESVN